MFGIKDKLEELLSIALEEERYVVMVNINGNRLSGARVVHPKIDLDARLRNREFGCNIAHHFGGRLKRRRHFLAPRRPIRIRAGGKPDLAQVLKAIKLVDVLNVFKQGTNGGTAAAWAMTCPTLPIMPPPVGTAAWFKPGVASVNGGTTFSLNGSAPKPVVCVDLSPIHIGDIVASAWLLLYFDGANWQVVAGSSRAPGMLPPLFAITNWYVNGSDRRRRCL